MATDDVYFLTEDDRNVLRDLIDRELRGRNHSRSRYGVEGENSQSPDVYVAHIPVAGIDPLDIGVSTGTGSWSDDTPGFVECGIYRLVESGGISDLKPTGVTRRVYNISQAAVPGNIWALVLRDKFGTWYIPPGPLGFSGCRLVATAIPTFSLSPTGTLEHLFDEFVSEGIPLGYTQWDTDNYHSVILNTGRIVAPSNGYYTFGTTILGLVSWDYATGIALGDTSPPSPLPQTSTLSIIKYNSVGGSPEIVSSSVFCNYNNAVDSYPIIAHPSGQSAATSNSGIIRMLAGEYADLRLTATAYDGSVYKYDISEVIFWTQKVGS
jgi:hypothetical protein